MKSLTRACTSESASRHVDREAENERKGGGGRARTHIIVLSLDYVGVVFFCVACGIFHIQADARVDYDDVE